MSKLASSVKSYRYECDLLLSQSRAVDIRVRSVTFSVESCRYTSAICYFGSNFYLLFMLRHKSSLFSNAVFEYFDVTCGIHTCIVLAGFLKNQ
jgi:hypothetical protein